MKVKCLRQNWRPFVYLLVLTEMLVACSRGTSQDLSEIQVDLAVSSNPPAVALATVDVALTGANNQPISGAKIELEGNERGRPTSFRPGLTFGKVMAGSVVEPWEPCHPL